ncbi:MAG: endonuclease/exonuclease/phosphatase family protein [Verrucomicrobia bacterium]|nr:endonuclease/exonuclease/phosphatase family protein [Verrucomicrobiota bacterium]
MTNPLRRLLPSPHDFFRIRGQLWGILTRAGLFAGLATVLGFLGFLWWPFDLAAHFRAQYFVFLTVLAVAFAAANRRRTAGFFAFLAMANLAVIVPLYLGRDARDPGAAPVFRAMLMNVNSRLGSATAVKRVIAEQNPHLVILEEVNESWIGKLVELKKSHPHAMIRPRNDNFGIALFSRLPLRDPQIVYIGEAEAPSVTAGVESDGVRFQVLGTHPVPPAGGQYSRWRDDQLARIPEFLAGFKEPILLLGDLNATPWSHPYRQLLSRSGLRNSQRGWGIQPTWPAYFFPLWIPIDHCLHSDGIVILRRKAGPNIHSDHYPLIVDFVVGGK